MNIIKWVLVLYGITAAAFGLYSFSIGYWGLVKKRPIVFPARQLMWFMFAMFAPLIVMLLSFLFQGREYIYWFLISMSAFQVATLVLVVFILWRQMSGYVVLGVSDETFRQALTNALNELNLPYQETISKIKLTSLSADLQVAVASWVGTAQIRIKQQQHIHYAKDIANAMDKYYKSNPVKVNNFAFITYLLLGGLLIVFVLAFSIFGFGFMFRFL